MTIVFQGHIKAIELNGAPVGKLAVTVVTPMSDAGGKEWTIFVPEDQCKKGYWVPGHQVQFTIHSFSVPAYLDAAPYPPQAKGEGHD